MKYCLPNSAVVILEEDTPITIRAYNGCQSGVRKHGVFAILCLDLGREAIAYDLAFVLWLDSLNHILLTFLS